MEQEQEQEQEHEQEQEQEQEQEHEHAGQVRLSGTLVCVTVGEAEIVRQHLPAHLALTRAETGCVSFDVRPMGDPMVWQVDEVFSDSDSFRAHQARAAASEWGRVTAGIERRYTVTGLES